MKLISSNCNLCEPVNMLSCQFPSRFFLAPINTGFAEEGLPIDTFLNSLGLDLVNVLGLHI